MERMLKIGKREIRVNGRFPRIAKIEGDKYCFLDEEEPAFIIENLKKCGERIDLFTFVQKVTDPSPKYDYPWEWDNFAALPVTDFDHWWKKQIKDKTRNLVRKAEKKGVTVKEVPFSESLAEGILAIYNESPIRQGKRFPHYGMKLDQIFDYAGSFPDQSKFIGAFLGEELIGFIKLTIDETKTQAGLMHILSMLQHRSKSPTNALLAQAVRCCDSLNIPYLIYSNFAYGKKQNDGLTKFKEYNGFQKIDVPRYYVPISLKGRICLTLGLHHHFAERIPEGWIEKLQNIRSAWYAKKAG